MDAPTTLEPKSFRLAFAGLLLAMLLGSLDQTIVSTALPTVVRDLGGLDQLSWVVTAYLLGATVVDAALGPGERRLRPQAAVHRRDRRLPRRARRSAGWPARSAS